MKLLLPDSIIGLLAGLTVAVGGALKDSPYEGFDLYKFIRSPIIGMVEGYIIGLKVKEARKSKFLLFFATIGTERATVETYKIIRKQTPGKFTNGEWGEQKCCLCEGGNKK